LSGEGGVENRLIQTDPTEGDHDEYFARLKKREGKARIEHRATGDMMERDKYECIFPPCKKKPQKEQETRARAQSHQAKSPKPEGYLILERQYC
jgi:hypothetical protein